MRLLCVFLLAFTLTGCEWIKENVGNFAFSKDDECISGSVEGTGSATVCPEDKEPAKEDPAT